MSQQAPSEIPAAATSPGEGIVIGDGGSTVDVYIDFMCPFCRDFELTSGPALRKMVADGAITLVYHPMSFLDDASTTRYSSRAAAASGCASDEDRFLEYADALFASQPPEGGPGLSGDELVRLGAAAGLTGAAFASGVRSGRYLSWPPRVTDLATERGVTSTPAVLVDGTPVPADTRSVAEAADAARGERA